MLRSLVSLLSQGLEQATFGCAEFFLFRYCQLFCAFHRDERLFGFVRECLEFNLDLLGCTLLTS